MDCALLARGVTMVTATNILTPLPHALKKIALKRRDKNKSDARRSVTQMRIRPAPFSWRKKRCTRRTPVSDGGDNGI